jgi:hypothetical protein
MNSHLANTISAPRLSPRRCSGNFRSVAGPLGPGDPVREVLALSFFPPSLSFSERPFGDGIDVQVYKRLLLS